MEKVIFVILMQVMQRDAMNNIDLDVINVNEHFHDASRETDILSTSIICPNRDISIARNVMSGMKMLSQRSSKT